MRNVKIGSTLKNHAMKRPKNGLKNIQKRCQSTRKQSESGEAFLMKTRFKVCRTMWKERKGNMYVKTFYIRLCLPLFHATDTRLEVGSIWTASPSPPVQFEPQTGSKSCVPKIEYCVVLASPLGCLANNTSTSFTILHASLFFLQTTYTDKGQKVRKLIILNQKQNIERGDLNTTVGSKRNAYTKLRCSCSPSAAASSTSTTSSSGWATPSRPPAST